MRNEGGFLSSEVTIVTRTRSRIRFLSRALDSILSQTFTDWELVIVNDGGDSGEVERSVAAKFSGRRVNFVILHLEGSAGMEKASNRGISASEGRHIVLHDDDDTWHPEFLERCIARLGSDEAGLITHTVKVFERDDNNNLLVMGYSPHNFVLTKAVGLDTFRSANPFPPVSFMYKRSCLEKTGMYDENMKLLGDWDFNIRFAEQFPISVLEEPLAFYHMRTCARSANSTADFEALKQAELQLRRKHPAFFRNTHDLHDFGNAGEAAGAETGWRDPETMAKVESFLKEAGRSRICLYGAGRFGRDFVNTFNLTSSNVAGFIDHDPCKIGADLEGYRVFRLEDLDEIRPDFVVLTVKDKNSVLHGLYSFLGSRRTGIKIIHDLLSAEEPYRPSKEAVLIHHDYEKLH